MSPSACSNVARATRPSWTESTLPAGLRPMLGTTITTRGALYAARRALTNDRSASRSTWWPPSSSISAVTDAHGVGHARVALDDLLDLLGEHLLPTTVDDRCASPEQLDLAVCPYHGQVSGHDVANAADRAEGLGGLFRILVVPDREVPWNRHEPRRTTAGRHLDVVGAKHLHRFTECELSGGRRVTSGRDAGAHADSLGRTEAVVDGHRRQVSHEPVLVRFAPHHPRRVEEKEARQVVAVAMVVELL